MAINRTSTHSIVIAGGGFAGALTAINLLDRASTPLSITIIERRAELGRGVAYSTGDAVHLVNGPAETFSIYPDDPDHLTRWLSANGKAYGWHSSSDTPGASFLPRSLYGAYVQGELNRAIAEARHGSNLRHLRSSAIELRSASHAIQVKTADGSTVEADEAVLALGVFPANPTPREASVAHHPGFADTPWNSAALERLVETDSLLLIGSSLSMVDAVASMEARGFRGRYQVISRRGQFVEARRNVAAVPDFLAGRPLPATARSLLSLVRGERRAIAARGEDWQGLPQALRPYILTLWRNANDRERRRFARHLRPFWDVAAHRAAPDSYRAVEAAVAAGRLSQQAATLLELRPCGVRIEATLKSRSRLERTSFDGVIDCRGHQLHDWRHIADPFVRNLVENGEVRPHPTGFGIDATPEGDLISEAGLVHRNLSAIGHPLRGVAWESSSISEQRLQAFQLADRILAKISQKSRAAS